jgi:hypothetical protein
MHVRLSQESTRITRTRNEFRKQIGLTVAQARANVTHDLKVFFICASGAPLARDPHALSDKRWQRGLGLRIEQRESLCDVASKSRHAISDVLPFSVVERGESEQLRR